MSTCKWLFSANKTNNLVIVIHMYRIQLLFCGIFPIFFFRFLFIFFLIFCLYVIDFLFYSHQSTDSFPLFDCIEHDLYPICLFDLMVESRVVDLN